MSAASALSAGFSALLSLSTTGFSALLDLSTAGFSALLGLSTSGFCTLLGLSAAGAAAALVCVAVSALLHRGGAPRWLCRILWLVVLARLLVPLSLPLPAVLRTRVPRAAASVSRLTVRLDEAALALSLPFSASDTDKTAAQSAPRADSADDGTAHPNAAAGSASTGALPAAPPAVRVSLLSLLSLLWLSVAAVLLVRAALYTAALHKSVRTAYLAPLSAENGGEAVPAENNSKAVPAENDAARARLFPSARTHPPRKNPRAPAAVSFAPRRPSGLTVRCYVGACVTAPFAAGVLRPRIYLPAALSPARRTHIILHESAHLRGGDTVLRPLFYLAACLHWFNPLAWLAFRRFVQEDEAACDEAVLRVLGPDAGRAYCQSLLHFAQPTHRHACTAAFGEGNLLMRIQAILHYKKPTLCVAVGAGIAVVLAAALCLTAPAFADAPDTALVPAAAQTETPVVSVDGAPSDADIPNAPEASSPGDAESTVPETPALLPDPTKAPAAEAPAAEAPATENAAVETSENPAETPETAVETSKNPAETPEVPAGNLPAPPADASAKNAEAPDALLWPMPAYTYCSRWWAEGRHKGVDICAPQGTPIYAVADGTVLFAAYGSDTSAGSLREVLSDIPDDGDSYGNLVVLDHGNGFLSVYAHCQSVSVKAGERVKQGDEVALVGSTGRATGNHCHLELRQDDTPLDPRPYFPVY